MSSDQPGGVELAADLLAQSKELIEAAEAEEAQLSLLDPVGPEDMIAARDLLGPKAGTLAVLHQARETRAKGGRKPGSRNKRTDDFARYILSFGQDPAITLMQIQNTQPEVLMEQSKVIDPLKRRMSLLDAQSLRVRCAEALMPFVHSKKPIAIDGTIRGVIVHETIGDMRQGGGELLAGEIVGVVLPGDER